MSSCVGQGFLHSRREHKVTIVNTIQIAGLGCVNRKDKCFFAIFKSCWRTVDSLAHINDALIRDWRIYSLFKTSVHHISLEMVLCQQKRKGQPMIPKIYSLFKINIHQISLKIEFLSTAKNNELIIPKIYSLFKTNIHHVSLLRGILSQEHFVHCPVPGW